MAAAAAAAEGAGKLPRAAGTRGVRNTPEKGELCLGGFSFLRLGNSELWKIEVQAHKPKIANTINTYTIFFFVQQI